MEQEPTQLPNKGETLRIINKPCPSYSVGDVVTVDYTISDLQKIIVTVPGKTTACLYEFEEGVVWQRTPTITNKE